MDIRKNLNYYTMKTQTRILSIAALYLVFASLYLWMQWFLDRGDGTVKEVFSVAGIIHYTFVEHWESMSFLAMTTLLMCVMTSGFDADDKYTSPPEPYRGWMDAESGYRIIEADSSWELNQEVSLAIKKGWRVSGPLDSKTGSRFGDLLGMNEEWKQVVVKP